MPITMDQSADRSGPLDTAELMFEAVLPEIRDMVRERGDEMVDFIFNNLWVNERVGNNPDGASGPSKSTGRSASEWFASAGAGVGTMKMELINPIDYAPYVRFPGDPIGQCGEDVERFFEAAMADLEVDIEERVRDYFAGI